MSHFNICYGAGQTSALSIIHLATLSVQNMHSDWKSLKADSAALHHAFYFLSNVGHFGTRLSDKGTLLTHLLLHYHMIAVVVLSRIASYILLAHLRNALEGTAKYAHCRPNPGSAHVTELSLAYMLCSLHMCVGVPTMLQLRKMAALLPKLCAFQGQEHVQCRCSITTCMCRATGIASASVSRSAC